MSKYGEALALMKAAKSKLGFVSKVDEAAAALQRNKGTGKEFMTELKKAPGVKAAEIKDRGLEKIESAPKMTKEQFLAELKKNPPPKIEETIKRTPTDKELEDVVDRLIDEEATSMTNDEIGRRTLSNREDWDDYFEGMTSQLNKDRDSFLYRAQEMSIENQLPESPKFGYDDLVIPGGKNYREILLRMPDPEKELKSAEAALRRAKQDAYFYRDKPDVIQRLASAEQRYANAQNAVQNAYHGSHWEEPNVLAHIRASDRTGPNGEKVLHIEEIQSDWHQTGRKYGYQDEEKYKKAREKADEVAKAAGFDDAYHAAQGWKMHKMENAKEASDLYDEASKFKPSGSVPDAPFKKNWHELAMKRMLNYAAENGYDKIAITPGAAQAERSNLARHVDRIDYFKNADGTYNFVAYSKSNAPILYKQDIGAEEMSELIGKDAAQKIIDASGQPKPEKLNVAKIGRNWEIIDQWGESVSKHKTKMEAEGEMQRMQSGAGTLPNVDLIIGDKPMKVFYDEMIPNYLNTFGKKYGVQVNPYDLSSDIFNQEAMNKIMLAPDDLRRSVRQEMIDTKQYETFPSHGFDITPEMREDIKSKGLPFYQQIGIPAGAGAAGADVLDQEEPGFAAGGMVGEEYIPDQSDGGLIIHDTDAFKRGGRVKISDNPDAMFIELRDKELNRK